MNNFYKDKKNIINWLDKYKVKNYTLILDERYGFVVDVNGDVYLNSKNLTFIPVKFNKINGGFYCSGNKLTSLEFCPQSVGKSFYCDVNPNLGKIQQIRDFKEIYAIHKNILVESFSNKLDTSLSYVEESKKINKVKL